MQKIFSIERNPLVQLGEKCNDECFGLPVKSEHKFSLLCALYSPMIDSTFIHESMTEY